MLTGQSFNGLGKWENPIIQTELGPAVYGGDGFTHLSLTFHDAFKVPKCKGEFRGKAVYKDWQYDWASVSWQPWGGEFVTEAAEKRILKVVKPLLVQFRKEGFLVKQLQSRYHADLTEKYNEEINQLQSAINQRREVIERLKSNELFIADKHIKTPSLIGNCNCPSCIRMGKRGPYGLIKNYAFKDHE